MFKRDLLLAQINKLYETVAKALLAIENHNLYGAEEIIFQNYSGILLNEFISSGKLPEDEIECENLLFQLELLYAQLKLYQAKSLPIKDLKEKYLLTANMILSRQKDFDLSLRLRVLEAERLK